MAPTFARPGFRLLDAIFMVLRPIGFLDAPLLSLLLHLSPDTLEIAGGLYELYMSIGQPWNVYLCHYLLEWFLGLNEVQL